MPEEIVTGNICLCKKISRAKMVKAYDEGARTVNRIKYKTGAGSGACKGRRCTPKIGKLLEELEISHQNNSDMTEIIDI